MDTNISMVGTSLVFNFLKFYAQQKLQSFVGDFLFFCFLCFFFWCVFFVCFLCFFFFFSLQENSIHIELQGPRWRDVIVSFWNFNMVMMVTHQNGESDIFSWQCNFICVPWLTIYNDILWKNTNCWHLPNCST